MDTHVYAGYEIPPFYDSMISKLIVHAPTREEAISTMRRALDEFLISPVKTTVDFHKKVLMNSYFQEGEFSTHFVEKFFSDKEGK